MSMKEQQTRDVHAPTGVVRSLRRRCPRVFLNVIVLILLHTVLGGIALYFFCVPQIGVPMEAITEPTDVVGRFRELVFPKDESEYYVPKQHQLAISPGSERISSILRGSTQQRTVRLFRVNPVEEEIYDVSFIGSYGGSIRGPAEIVLPQGVREVPYVYEVVSEGLPNGEYEMRIQFIPRSDVGHYVVAPSKSSPKENTLSGSAVVSGIRLIVRFTVTGEEFVSYALGNTVIASTEESRPLNVDVHVANDGNIAWRPDSATLFVYNEGEEFPMSEVTKENSGQDVVVLEPGQRGSQQFVFTHALDPGKYDGQLAVRYRGETVFVSVRKNFIVYERGALAQMGEFVAFTSNKDSYLVNELVSVTGVFENTGEVDYACYLTMEMFYNDTLVDVVRTKESEVKSGAVQEFSQVLSFAEVGNYRIESYVEYGERVSSKRIIHLLVQEGMIQEKTFSGFLKYLLLGIIFLFILAVVYAFVRDVRKGRSES